MSDKKNTEIAVNEGFAALANRDVLNEAMADDCQGLEFSFDRVKLPAGGGTAFEIPSAESDESEMAKDITIPPMHTTATSTRAATILPTAAALTA
jgi:hypothetical protein